MKTGLIAEAPKKVLIFVEGRVMTAKVNRPALVVRPLFTVVCYSAVMLIAELRNDSGIPDWIK